MCVCVHVTEEQKKKNKTKLANNDDLLEFTFGSYNFVRTDLVSLVTITYAPKGNFARAMVTVLCRAVLSFDCSDKYICFDA